jgi:hypothetical protein
VYAADTATTHGPIVRPPGGTPTLTGTMRRKSVFVVVPRASDCMAEVQARRSKKGAALDDRSSRGELVGRKRRTEEMPTEAQPSKRTRTVTSPKDVGRRGTEPQADGEGTSSHCVAALVRPRRSDASDHSPAAKTEAPEKGQGQG